jgi:REP element-mobilizing transposase RayT
MPQSLAKVYLHVVYSTKHRQPILADEWREELFRVMGGATNNLGCQSLIAGGVADRVHLLFALTPITRPSAWASRNDLSGREMRLFTKRKRTPRRR